MSPSTRCLAVLWLAVLLAGCATGPNADLTTTTDFDTRYDFSGVRSIAIQPVDRANPATVIISDIQVARIDAALTEELERRGFEVVADNADADMLLAWHLVTRERADVRGYNSVSRYDCWSCPGGGSRSAHEYTRGTLIIDMIDPVALRSVWRAVMESPIRAQADPEQAAQNRRTAARQILAEFPPPES